MSTAQKVVHRPKWRRGWNSWILLIVCTTGIVIVLFVNFDPSTESVSFERSCRVPWFTVDKAMGHSVCLTTMSDAKVDSAFKKAARRNFTDVLEATWMNKKRYAQKHGYRLFNASHLIDTERPPSWSKILAVKDALKQRCEWVFWMDPDSLIMNSRIRIEDILPHDQHINLIVTKDATGYNAGMWIIRRGTWTTSFLNAWWSMTDFIRKPGDTKSGDNDAFKAALGGMKEIDKHVSVAPQCAFNSYLWTTNFKSLGRYLWKKKAIMDGVYRDGDFLLHFAGIDDKMGLIDIYKRRAD